MAVMEKEGEGEHQGRAKKQQRDESRAVRIYN